MNYFISHSSRDKKVIDKFVQLILVSGLGVRSESIFYSSQKSTGIPIGKNIYQELRSNLKNTKVFIPIFSMDYLESKICLSELGGAWLYEIQVFPLLIPPLKFKDLKNVIDYEHIIIENIIDPAGLDHFKDAHDEFTKLSSPISSWNNYKGDFLSSVKTLINENDSSNSRGKYLSFCGRIEERSLEIILEGIEKITVVRSRMIFNNGRHNNPYKEVEVELEYEIDRLTIHELFQDKSIPDEIRDTLRLV